MIREAIGFGQSIEEAKEDALAKLGASELDDIQFDVITVPKKKVLGVFGGSMAEVKAYIETPDPKAPKKAKPEKKPQNKTKTEKIKQPKAEEPVKKETAPKKEASSEYGPAVDEKEIDPDSNVSKAIAYIRTVLAAFNCGEVSIKVASKENASLITLDGEDLSIAIGRRGETLDALQYLSSLAANNGGGHYKISLNIGNYREKRAETLTNLANRISAQVLKTGKSRTLEPMNPYERRIIHTAVQEIEGVVSNSFGEGAGRRIVISLEGAQVRPPRNNDRRRGSRSSHHRSAKPTVTPVAREPKRDSDMPLYGKIN